MKTEKELLEELEALGKVIEEVALDSDLSDKEKLKRVLPEVSKFTFSLSELFGELEPLVKSVLVDTLVLMNSKFMEVLEDLSEEEKEEIREEIGNWEKSHSALGSKYICQG
jgi:hypothetical protein